MSSYDPALRLGAVLDSPEPILYEDCGWGIFGNNEEIGTSPGDIDKKANGHTLTHIGCDCEFPNWAYARLIWRHFIPGAFSCHECGDIISEETFKKLCKVYNLINNITLTTGNDWHI